MWTFSCTPHCLPKSNKCWKKCSGFRILFCSVAFCTVHIYAPLKVEMGTTGEVEGQKCQGADIKDWNLGALVSYEQDTTGGTPWIPKFGCKWSQLVPEIESCQQKYSSGLSCDRLTTLTVSPCMSSIATLCFMFSNPAEIWKPNRHSTQSVLASNIQCISLATEKYPKGTEHSQIPGLLQLPYKDLADSTKDQKTKQTGELQQGFHTPICFVFSAEGWGASAGIFSFNTQQMLLQCLLLLIDSSSHQTAWMRTHRWGVLVLWDQKRLDVTAEMYMPLQQTHCKGKLKKH